MICMLGTGYSGPLLCVTYALNSVTTFLIFVKSVVSFSYGLFMSHFWAPPHFLYPKKKLYA